MGLFNEPPCNKSSKTHVCLFTITFFCINKPQSSFTALARHLLWLLFLLVILYFKVHTNWRPHRFTSNPLSLPPCAAHPLRCILHLWVFFIYPAHMLSPSRPPPHPTPPSSETHRPLTSGPSACTVIWLAVKNLEVFALKITVLSKWAVCSCCESEAGTEVWLRLEKILKKIGAGKTKTERKADEESEGNRGDQQNVTCILSVEAPGFLWELFYCPLVGEPHHQGIM